MTDVTSFDDLLDGSLPELLATRGRRPLLMRGGDTGRLSALFDWPTLNRILESRNRDWVDPDRSGDPDEVDAVTISRGGILKQAPEFSQTVTGQTRHPVKQFDPVQLNHELRAGATIVVRRVDRHAPEVKALAGDVERALGALVTVRAFATVRDQPAVGTHRDRHDVIVCQVAGSKRWQLTAPEEPLTLPDGEDATPPASAPTFDEVVSSGDVLYVPRGWWHQVTPEEDPSLHLSFDIHTPTGADLLAFVRSEVCATLGDAPVPRFADADEQGAYLGRLRDAILDAWSDDHLVDRFLQHADETAIPSRATLSLPWSATRSVLPDRAVVRWLGVRNINVDNDETGTTRLRSQGQTIELDASITGRVLPLLDGVPRRVDELTSGLEERSADDLRTRLVDLALAGHLEVG